MTIKEPLQPAKTLRRLCSGIEHKNVTHAYIFEGEAGLGKREAAYYFAQTLLCEKSGSEPCGECESCVLSQAKSNPDIKSYSLKALTDKKSIGVEEIRDVISDAYTKPFRAPYKVYIIEDADALTAQAQNAMLKILEEPPEYIVFIMCVTSIGRILSTVQSRSRVIRFSAASESEIQMYVKNKYPHMADKASFAASYSEGIFSKVDELFENDDVLKLRQKLFLILQRLLTDKDEGKALDSAAEFDEIRAALSGGSKKAAGESFLPALNIMLSQAMDILKIKSGAKECVVNKDMQVMLFAIAESITCEKAANCAGKIILAQDMLQRHVGFKSAMLCLCIGIWDFD